jgi:AcrR family transcriptional regulator
LFNPLQALTRSTNHKRLIFPKGIVVPRPVDTEQRRRDIIEAAKAVLARQGTRGLTFRSVAQQMGGSTSLITHYFATQRDLLDELTRHTLEGWDAEVRAIDEASDDPAQRLAALLYWLLPTTDVALGDELTRIHLLAGQLLGDEHRALFDAWDDRIRGYLRSHLEGLVEPENVERTVELLRVVTSGIVLSVVEHPDLWPAQRQIAVLEDVLDLKGLETALRFKHQA